MTRHLQRTGNPRGHDVAVGCIRSPLQFALESNAKMGARAWLAHTQYDYGHMLLEHGVPGDHEHAVQLVTLAMETAREQGMEALIGKASALSIA